MSLKLNHLFILFILVSLVAACSAGEKTPEGASTPTTGATSAHDSPLPAPTATLSALDSPLPTPTRGPSTQTRAAVRGVLFLTNPETTLPQEQGIYLVPIDADESGGAMVFPALDPETALQAEVDEGTGEFFFDDLEVGLYALVALTRRGTQLSIRKLETGEAQIVMIEESDADQVIDLGRLRLP
jgi:hypothetical protein